MSSLKVIREIRKRAVRLRARNCSESDTIANLINPVLEYLGYPPENQRRDGQIRSNRPDIVIWDDPHRMDRGEPATAIIEVKSLDTNLNDNGLARQERPKEQIARYVTGYENADSSTVGVLTDGNIWHLVVPVENRRGVKKLDEFCLLENTERQAACNLDNLQTIINNYASTPGFRQERSRTRRAREFTNAISNNESSESLLDYLVRDCTPRSPLPKSLNLQGKAKYAEESYWVDYAYTIVKNIRTEIIVPDLDEICVAIVKMKRSESENDRSIYREDVATVASTFAKVVPQKLSVVVVIQPDEDNHAVNARIAVHHQRHTGMTTEFDPYTPQPMILSTIQRICNKLAEESVGVSDFAEIVSAQQLRTEFFEAVANGWTLRQYQNASGDSKRMYQYKSAVLRHLIRTLFVWILKEEGVLPQEIFDETFASVNAPDNYHEEVLSFLFHERLNEPETNRIRHKKSEKIHRAMEDIRFLNGSIFARHQHDGLLQIPNEEYFIHSDDLNDSGLFSILSAYDWSALEHTSTISDQTIDPEVLSNLFENLIAVTETDQVLDRMPGGTYYTPVDVAGEMCKDALMMAVRKVAPRAWKEPELLVLFEDSDTRLPEISLNERKRLVERINELTIFDPAVGSGVFLLNIVNAINCAKSKLLGSDVNGVSIRRIISNQIHGQDINPMSVQITRLRLYIAIIKSEISSPQQLPNLEAKIVCADTLNTVPDHAWRPTKTGEFQDTDPRVVNALMERADIFSQWQNAHEEAAKSDLRKRDERVRAKLRDAASVGMSGTETIAFAEYALLEPDAPPAKTDPRLLFYRKDWLGFDVVIGNPPYQRIPRHDPIRNELIQRGYQTEPAGDLYAFILEAGLSLIKRENGVLTFVVPFSICFGQNKSCVRTLLEENTGEIRLRSQDNRPGTTFHASPVANQENRQRTTILTAITKSQVDQSDPKILVTGINKWRRSERNKFLELRNYNLRSVSKANVDNRIRNQWERISSEDIKDLILAMKETQYKFKDIETKMKYDNLPENGLKRQLLAEFMVELESDSENHNSIGFPNTAYEYITAVPAGKLKRSEWIMRVGSLNNLGFGMAVANSHIAYAWWKVYDDAFHVNQFAIEHIAIPQKWIDDYRLRMEIVELGNELIGRINQQNINERVAGPQGRIVQNLNFHECAAEVIEKIDRQYISALGLSLEPLLTHLKALRSNSTWRIGLVE